MTRAGDDAKCLSCKGNWDLTRVQVTEWEGTSRVKRSKRSRRVKVSADGVGVASHAGVGMLRELAQDTGLVAGVTAALADTYDGPWLHAPGEAWKPNGQNGLHKRDLGQRRGMTGIAPPVEVRLQLASVLEIVTPYRAMRRGKFDDRATASCHDIIDADVRDACPSTVITNKDLHVRPHSLELPRDAAMQRKLSRES